ncbi:MAG: TonB-dependent receptor [Gammaproteobacteria bacterium]|nr:TonB-dependent receptor [Gammaproteobacteria bacterium]MDE0413107.1 TonB-dependent receptor [Gammaproteobacteria bacterium]
MNRFNDHADFTWRKSGSAFAWLLSVIAGLALSIGVATAQEEAGEADEEEALELPDVRVTGSRLNRPPSELSGNLIVLDRDDIRASGELTLARVLRQLPQNVNATNETYGSELNNVPNLTGAATVNLRGLGSESTLILVDGRRIGYSGLLGGVTDISTIPLSMVDRIEILLDGASAVYGSDAVGGVVNIITRKDYSGVELDLNYGRPHKSGYDETRASLSAGFSWNGGQMNVGYEQFRDSGLDASKRDSIINANRDDSGLQQRGAPGPQVRLYSWFFDRSCNESRAIVYELNGSILSRDEYAALDETSKASAVCHADITVPLGFMPGDDLDGIEIFGAPRWGERTEAGASLRPEQNHDTVNLAIEQALAGSLRLRGNLRWGNKESSSERGLNSFSNFLHANSPYNPFGIRVTAMAQILNAPPSLFDSDTDELFASVGVDGSFGETWTWQAEFSRSEQEIASQRLNVLDSTTVRNGMNSDGVSDAQIAFIGGISQAECEARRIELGGTRISYSSFFGGQCRVYGAPPDPISPFGDLTSYIAADLRSGSQNEQTQFEALARGELFDAPGGAIAVVIGYDYREDKLDSFSEFHVSGNSCSVISCPYSSAVGNAAFNTSVTRTNHAGFFEGLIPLIGADNAGGAQRLNVTLSGRYDSYSDVEVAYRESQSGEAGTDTPQDPGSEFTYGVGLVYQINDYVRLKASQQTSFVAPQLNQLLQRTRDRSPATSFEQLCLITDQGCRFTNNTWNVAGGNGKLVPETADTLSLISEISPPFLPGVFLRAAWSETEFKDRIAYLGTSSFNVDPNNLPSDIIYLPDEDIYLVDRRWINVAQLDRAGIDYELRYEWEMGANEYSIRLQRSYTNRYNVMVDQAGDKVHDLVTERDDSGPQDARSIAPVPKHQTSMQFTWKNGGLFASIDVQGAAKVSTLVSTTIQDVTVPATHYDLVLGYQFGNDSFFRAPGWLRGWDATLAINNLTNAAADNYRRNPETGDVQQYELNPFFEWTQGRSYRLALRKSF